MVVEGPDGAPLGMVERFEIDARGQVTSVVVRLAAKGGACKCVAAKYIQDIGVGILTLALSTAELACFGDVPVERPDELLLEHLTQFPGLR